MEEVVLESIWYCLFLLLRLKGYFYGFKGIEPRSALRETNFYEPPLLYDGDTIRKEAVDAVRQWIAITRSF